VIALLSLTSDAMISVSKRRNSVALGKIDLESGDISRKMFLDCSELEAMAVKKLHIVDRP
jgi:hypothetical protein